MAAEFDVNVPVSHSTYDIAGLAFGYEEDVDKPDVARGLLTADGVSASVIVAAEWEVPVRLRLLGSMPTVSAGEWEDVVEFSLRTEEDLRLRPLFDAPVGPDLAHEGPGSYRLRLHARGRDRTVAAYLREGMPDPENDTLTAEAHLLQVWPAATAPARVIKLTSAFAQTWGMLPPKRTVDYEALAQQAGLRLIVGWQELQPPADSGTLTVEVNAVLPLTPEKAVKKFDHANPGYLGSSVGGDPARPNWIHAGIDGGNDSVGGLTVEGEHLERIGNTRLRFSFGFEDFRGYSDERPPRKLLGPTHPIPSASTMVEMTFDKHENGCLVTVRHEDVPQWLSDDVAALWHLILEHNSHDEWSPWPWQA